MEAAGPVIDPSLRIGTVALTVGDLARSVDFYERVLGLGVIERDEERAVLGIGGERPALRLRALSDPHPASPHSTGLFHVAWLHPSRAALAGTLQRLLRTRWPVTGASDHGVSEAIYLSDPDGLGIEVYADRPRERWARPADGRGVSMVTLPLDVEDLLAQAPVEALAALPADTAIGHVHLKVSDVPRAVRFYRDALGLREQARMPSAAFLAADDYHHHVALNSWQSAGAGPPPPGAPGLSQIEFELDGADALEALERGLERAAQAPAGVERGPDRVAVRDPDGNALQFVASAAS